MSENGYGLLISIIIGIAGSFLETWAFGELVIKIGGGVVSDIIRGASGAIIILFILSLFKRGTYRRR